MRPMAICPCVRHGPGLRRDNRQVRLPVPASPHSNPVRREVIVPGHPGDGVPWFNRGDAQERQPHRLRRAVIGSARGSNNDPAAVRVVHVYFSNVHVALPSIILFPSGGQRRPRSCGYLASLYGAIPRLSRIRRSTSCSIISLPNPEMINSRDSTGSRILSVVRAPHGTFPCAARLTACSAASPVSGTYPSADVVARMPGSCGTGGVLEVVVATGDLLWNRDLDARCTAARRDQCRQGYIF